MQYPAPKIVALVGFPKVGKTTAAEVMEDKWNTLILDSGLPMREISMKYFGLTPNQCFTQSGKESFVNILGGSYQIRQILGDMGKKFEDMFGEYTIPYMSYSMLKDTELHFVDASCRKTQGKFWKEKGGYVIHIKNPLYTKADYDFDKFDMDCIDYTIVNDGQYRGLSLVEGKAELYDKINEVFGKIAESAAK